MSSIRDTYKIIVAGDEESGYSFCTRLMDRQLPDPRKVALESLSKDWPKDEWVKFITLSSKGTVFTMELDLELHGPWIWELYNVMDPRDYFRRFAAAVICANPKRPESLIHIPSFIESMDTHIGKRIPMVLIIDSSQHISKNELKPVEEIALQMEIPFRKVSIETGDNLDNVLKELAIRIQETEE
ncbi:MAG: hypothetical protein ACFFEF_05605 [Candidatus Thorarchaeota archaeon]